MTQADVPPVDVEAVTVGETVLFQGDTTGEWMYTNAETVVTLDDAV